MQNPLPQGGGFSRFMWQGNFSFTIKQSQKALVSMQTNESAFP